jgi:hypothetical protein
MGVLGPPTTSSWQPFGRGCTLLTISRKSRGYMLGIRQKQRVYATHSTKAEGIHYSFNRGRGYTAHSTVHPAIQYGLRPLICQRLQNGAFHTLHAQLKGRPGKCFEFQRMSISSLFNTSLSIKFSTLKTNYPSGLQIWKLRVVLYARGRLLSRQSEKQTQLRWAVLRSAAGHLGNRARVETLPRFSRPCSHARWSQWVT